MAPACPVITTEAGRGLLRSWGGAAAARPDARLACPPRHRDEYADNGLTKLTGDALRQFKSDIKGAVQDATCPLGLENLKATSHLNLFDRRAVLLTGMLLTESEVARQVRSYLLDAALRASGCGSIWTGASGLCDHGRADGFWAWHL